MNYTLADILNEEKNIVICVNYKKDAIELLEKFNELKLKWWNNDSYLYSNNWDDYQEKTCYKPSTGEFARREFWWMNQNVILKYKDVKHLFNRFNFHMTELDV